MPSPVASPKDSHPGRITPPVDTGIWRARGGRFSGRAEREWKFPTRATVRLAGFGNRKTRRLGRDVTALRGRRGVERHVDRLYISTYSKQPVESE